jgi:hypothetical protein
MSIYKRDPMLTYRANHIASELDFLVASTELKRFDRLKLENAAATIRREFPSPAPSRVAGAPAVGVGALA